jgi:hypothetical protein
MKFLHINNNNSKDINKDINNGKDVFLLIYMEGCGPCNMVRPEWKKIENIFQNKNNKKYNNVVIADIESELLDNIKLTNQPVGFPTMKYISNKGKHEENYEGERDVDSFIQWINTKIKDSNSNTFKRKIHKGGKWTKKYKKSINCKRPKGFSQKQYCKYGRKNKY